jgi:hypothetical protein
VGWGQLKFLHKNVTLSKKPQVYGNFGTVQIANDIISKYEFSDYI